MAKAYGGDPLTNNSKRNLLKRRKPTQRLSSDERPLTDRLYPSLMRREEDRVKKIAKVAYRQQIPEDNEEAADGVGFQEFFKEQMEELEKNRVKAREDYQRNQEIVFFG